MKKFFFLIVFYFIIWTSFGQIADTLRSKRLWNANWIGYSNPYDKGTDYGVYYFRKGVYLKDKPAKFIIHVSADNHYKLYINGKLAGIGPTRGDLHNWHYETIDISNLLNAGENTVAAMVWNEGESRPEYQISLRTSFIIQGNTSEEEIMNTNNTWKCKKDEAFSPVWGHFLSIHGQYVDMNKTVKNWNYTKLDDSSWSYASNLWGGQPKGFSDGFGYMLVPSNLPAMEMTYQPITIARKVDGIDSFSVLKLPITIPANKKVTILLDQTYLTNAYPTIKFSGGKDAGISLGYAEALYEKGSGYKRKGDRNKVDGMEFTGLSDSITSNGELGQSYTPFHFRTYRYLKLLVQTSNEPLVIDSLYGTFTAYPFKAEAVFNSDNNEIQKILEIGWHTARLNAYDNYFTGQYYERIQYIGDARIQALINYFYSSDSRLTRNALEQIGQSLLPEGITLSRYPTRNTQIIPTFSLLYVGMLHDYWMYRNDTSFIKDKLASIRSILSFFNKYQQSDASLHNTPYWNFVDWADGKNWFFGSPPRDVNGESALIDMHLLLGYQWAADMETNLGLSMYANLYNKKASQLKQTIRQKYWDETKGLYADTREKITFSQHCNALALLTGVVNDENKLEFSKRLISDSTLTKCSMYFSYYLHEALIKGGLGEDYINWLGPWRESIKMGLTTWAEEPNLITTRSDCHAWSSGPNIIFYKTVLGIDAYSSGFQEIKIEPHLGKLTKVSGEIPHPNGKVGVSYELKHRKWNINISIPEKTSAVFIWKGTTFKLKEGSNLLII